MVVAGVSHVEVVGSLVPLTLVVLGRSPAGLHLGALAVGALLIVAAMLGRVDPMARIGMGRSERVFSLAALLVAAWLFAGILHATTDYEARASVECPTYGTLDAWSCDDALVGLRPSEGVFVAGGAAVSPPTP